MNEGSDFDYSDEASSAGSTSSSSDAESQQRATRASDGRSGAGGGETAGPSRARAAGRRQGGGTAPPAGDGGIRRKPSSLAQRATHIDGAARRDAAPRGVDPAAPGPHIRHGKDGVIEIRSGARGGGSDDPPEREPMLRIPQASGVVAIYPSSVLIETGRRKGGQCECLQVAASSCFGRGHATGAAHAHDIRSVTVGTGVRNRAKRGAMGWLGLLVGLPSLLAVVAALPGYIICSAAGACIVTDVSLDSAVGAVSNEVVELRTDEAVQTAIAVGSGAAGLCLLLTLLIICCCSKKAVISVNARGVPAGILQGKVPPRRAQQVTDAITSAQLRSRGYEFDWRAISGDSNKQWLVDWSTKLRHARCVPVGDETLRLARLHLQVEKRRAHCWMLGQGFRKTFGYGVKHNVLFDSVRWIHLARDGRSLFDLVSYVLFAVAGDMVCRFAIPDAALPDELLQSPEYFDIIWGVVLISLLLVWVATLRTQLRLGVTGGEIIRVGVPDDNTQDIADALLRRQLLAVPRGDGGASDHLVEDPDEFELRPKLVRTWVKRGQSESDSTPAFSMQLFKTHLVLRYGGSERANDMFVVPLAHITYVRVGFLGVFSAFHAFMMLASLGAVAAWWQGLQFLGLSFAFLVVAGVLVLVCAAHFAWAARHQSARIVVGVRPLDVDAGLGTPFNITTDIGHDACAEVCRIIQLHASQARGRAVALSRARGAGDDELLSPRNALGDESDDELRDDLEIPVLRVDRGARTGKRSEVSAERLAVSIAHSGSSGACFASKHAASVDPHAIRVVTVGSGARDVSRRPFAAWVVWLVGVPLFAAVIAGIPAYLVCDSFDSCVSGGSVALVSDVTTAATDAVAVDGLADPGADARVQTAIASGVVAFVGALALLFMAFCCCSKQAVLNIDATGTPASVLQARVPEHSAKEVELGLIRAQLLARGREWDDEEMLVDPESQWQETWTETAHEFGCLRVGEESFRAAEHHYLLEHWRAPLECLPGIGGSIQYSLRRTVLTDHVRWAHYSSHGRSVLQLVLAITVPLAFDLSLRFLVPDAALPQWLLEDQWIIDLVALMLLFMLMLRWAWSVQSRLRLGVADHGVVSIAVPFEYSEEVMENVLHRMGGHGGAHPSSRVIDQWNKAGVDKGHEHDGGAGTAMTLFADRVMLKSTTSMGAESTYIVPLRHVGYVRAGMMSVWGVKSGLALLAAIACAVAWWRGVELFGSHELLLICAGLLAAVVIVGWVWALCHRTATIIVGVNPHDLEAHAHANAETGFVIEVDMKHDATADVVRTMQLAITRARADYRARVLGKTVVEPENSDDEGGRKRMLRQPLSKRLLRERGMGRPQSKASCWRKLSGSRLCLLWCFLVLMGVGSTATLVLYYHTQSLDAEALLVADNGDAASLVTAALTTVVAGYRRSAALAAAAHVAGGTFGEAADADAFLSAARDVQLRVGAAAVEGRAGALSCAWRPLVAAEERAAFEAAAGRLVGADEDVPIKNGSAPVEAARADAAGPFLPLVFGVQSATAFNEFTDDGVAARSYCVDGLSGGDGAALEAALASQSCVSLGAAAGTGRWSVACPAVRSASDSAAGSAAQATVDVVGAATLSFDVEDVLRAVLAQAALADVAVVLSAPVSTGTSGAGLFAAASSGARAGDASTTLDADEVAALLASGDHAAATTSVDVLGREWQVTTVEAVPPAAGAAELVLVLATIVVSILVCCLAAAFLRGHDDRSSGARGGAGVVATSPVHASAQARVRLLGQQQRPRGYSSGSDAKGSVGAAQRRASAATGQGVAVAVAGVHNGVDGSGSAGYTELDGSDSAGYREEVHSIRRSDLEFSDVGSSDGARSSSPSAAADARAQLVDAPRSAEAAHVRRDDGNDGRAREPALAGGARDAGARARELRVDVHAMEPIGGAQHAWLTPMPATPGSSKRFADDAVQRVEHRPQPIAAASARRRSSDADDLVQRAERRPQPIVARAPAAAASRGTTRASAAAVAEESAGVQRTELRPQPIASRKPAGGAHPKGRVAAASASTSGGDGDAVQRREAKPRPIGTADSGSSRSLVGFTAASYASSWRARNAALLTERKSISDDGRSAAVSGGAPARAASGSGRGGIAAAFSATSVAAGAVGALQAGGGASRVGGRAQPAAAAAARAPPSAARSDSGSGSESGSDSDSDLEGEFEWT